MYEDTVVLFSHPDRISIEDPLTQVLRLGARRLLADAVEAEVEAFIAAHADLADEAGRRRVVRHGYQPEREVQTGIGAVAVRRPRVRDRQPEAGRGRIRFTSSILPPYLRRAKSVEELLPWLYLKGISTGDFGEALAALLGPDAPGLSATNVIRLKTAWAEEYERWLRRDLSAKRYVHLWADGVYFSPRLEHDKQCLLAIIGADEIGNKDIVGLSDGYRESEQTCQELTLFYDHSMVRDSALRLLRSGQQGRVSKDRCWRRLHASRRLKRLLSMRYVIEYKAFLILRSGQQGRVSKDRGPAATCFETALRAPRHEVSRCNVTLSSF